MDEDSQKLLAECRARKAERIQDRALKKRAKPREGYRQRSENYESRLPEYRVWRNMLRRCYDERDDWYNRYGGRGISVCQEWRDSFSRFLADVGPRPSNNHQIDRRDNDGNYEPSNCTWSTAKEQAGNRRTAITITINGESQCAKYWCEHFRISYEAFKSRRRRDGDPKDIIFDLAGIAA